MIDKKMPEWLFAIRNKFSKVREDHFNRFSKMEPSLEESHEICYKDGFQAAIESKEVQGLIEALEQIVSLDIYVDSEKAFNIAFDALAAFKGNND